MESTTKEQILTAAAEQIKSKGVSDAEAARQMRMSGATLSNMKKGSWENISDSMWLKLANWAGFKFNDWKLRETAQLATIANLLNDAQENSRMLGLSAETGLGKTTGIEHYYRSTRNVFKVLCTHTMSRKDFLVAIQSALAIEVEGSIHRRVESIVEKLAGLNRPLLILDDAGKLNDPCLLLIQIFYDQLEGRCGIVLAGMPYLKRYIYKMAAKDKRGFSELKRRVGYWETLLPVSRSIVSHFCSDFKIEDPNAIDFVYRTCKDYGTLREMLTNAQRLARREDCPITLSILENVRLGDYNFHKQSA